MQIKSIAAAALLATAFAVPVQADTISDMVDVAVRAPLWLKSKIAPSLVDDTIHQIRKYCEAADAAVTVDHLPDEDIFQRYEIKCSIGGNSPLVISARQNGKLFAATIQPLESIPAFCEAVGMESVFVKQTPSESVQICTLDGQTKILIYSSFANGVLNVVAQE